MINRSDSSLTSGLGSLWGCHHHREVLVRLSSSSRSY